MLYTLAKRGDLILPRRADVPLLIGAHHHKPSEGGRVPLGQPTGKDLHGSRFLATSCRNLSRSLKGEKAFSVILESYTADQSTRHAVLGHAGGAIVAARRG